jgi:hypothetical protein
MVALCKIYSPNFWNLELPAKDRYHDRLKRALIKDQWLITDEQVKLKICDRRLWIDIEAEHQTERTLILVEVKEMMSASQVDDLSNSVGQYLMYRVALESKNIPISLYMAVSTSTFQGILSEEIGQLMIERFQIALIVFNPDSEVITEWRP